MLSHSMRSASLKLWPCILFSLLLGSLLLTACSGSAQVNTPTSVTGNPPVPTTSSSGTAVTPEANIPATSAGYPLHVFFAKSPESNNDPNRVFPVDRNAPNLAVGTFAIQQLILGPTQEEKSKGYYSQLQGIFLGTSDCGADFKLTLNMRALTPEPGTATVRFCRDYTSAGAEAEALIISEITNSLTQFSTIKKVVVLAKNSRCIGDFTGQDKCLQSA